VTPSRVDRFLMAVFMVYCVAAFIFLNALIAILIVDAVS
jgi:hypothetical protein